MPKQFLVDNFVIDINQFNLYLQPQRIYRMKKIIVLMQALLFSYSMFAQESIIKTERASSNSPEIISKVRPQQDARLDSMLNWHIENNLKKGGVDGFRVEIFFSSAPNAKEKALEIKREFLTRFPDIDVYIKFNAPDFKVRVGDFRTKNEALKLKKKLDNKYPKSFIVPDLIKFPELISSEKEKNQYE